MNPRSTRAAFALGFALVVVSGAGPGVRAQESAAPAVAIRSGWLTRAERHDPRNRRLGSCAVRRDDRWSSRRDHSTQITAGCGRQP